VESQHRCQKKMKRNYAKNENGMKNNYARLMLEFMVIIEIIIQLAGNLKIGN
jgi:hypothetical protein